MDTWCSKTFAFSLGYTGFYTEDFVGSLSEMGEEGVQRNYILLTSADTEYHAGNSLMYKVHSADLKI